MGDHLWLQERKCLELGGAVGGGGIEVGEVAPPLGKAWPEMSASPSASQSRAEKAVFEAEG